MRYSSRPLPAAPYLPGLSPRSARPAPAARHTPAGDLAADDDFRHGLDLFNHGFPWEAHEAWEPLWREAAGPNRALLHGLIQLAAAAVKARTGALAPARKLVAGALAHLAGAGDAIIDTRALAARLTAWAADPAQPPPAIELA